MKQFITLFILSLLCQSAEAKHQNKLNTCKITHAAKNNYEPEVFFQGNNLLRKAGQEELFCGQKIVLKLEILDKNCVPISDAKVYLWQVGCDGKYPYKPLRTKVNPQFINTEPGSTFVGSGIATTNNAGNAKFITILPPSSHHESSINIRIEHSHYGSFQTQLHPKKNMIIEDDIFDMIETRIVTPWENNYKRY
jgi:protocatechuate 3,4-dioxygenase beta subunit